MSDRYFVSTPGSDDPPKGPLTREDIEREVASGTIPGTAVVCKVGEATWEPITTLAPSQAPVAPTPPASAAPATSASPTEAERYKNLVSVSKSLSSAGNILQIVAVVVVLGALNGALIAYSSSPTLALALAAGASLGVPMYALGVITAACGEALLALRDIAVNTRPAGAA